MAVAEGMRVQFNFIDLEIGKVLKAQDHCRLAQNANQMKEHIEVVQRQLDMMVAELKQLEAEMSGHGMDPASSSEYVVHTST